MNKQICVVCNSLQECFDSGTHFYCKDRATCAERQVDVIVREVVIK